MYYEINVSLNGVHFFATAERSITDQRKLKVVLEKIVSKFPTEEGYLVSVSYNEVTGKILKIEDILK
jgi:hypothetical protein